MRATLLTTLLVHLATALKQNISESSIFEIGKALLENGVDFSAIPELYGWTERSSTRGCEIACNALKLVFGDAKVEYQGEAAYDTVTNAFWSAQQQEPKPHCIFKPEKSLDVSTQILISRLTKCPFAVKSGGHAAFAGASNIDGGITTTFENMKAIALSKDKKIASIEPGSLWYDIFTTLANDNLAVVGGRVSGIGIGGLTTGGGISFFSNQYGWACDNVASFEVVIASGAIVIASPTSFPDLYWALRGGGNNFGIVTKFNLETFVHGPQMFGGQKVFFNTSFPAAIDAFVNLGVNAANDLKATQLFSIALDVASGTKIAVAELEYADPVIDAPIFDEYRSIPAFADTLQLNTLAYFTQQLNNTNPDGFRESYWTVSTKLDKHIVEFLFDVSFQEFENIQDVEGIVPASSLQVITVPQLQQMQKKGGNALRLTPSDGPILLVNLNTRWNNINDDERVLKASANIITKVLEEAKSRNLESKFLYMNYASQFQDVIGSYGDNKQKLKDVAHKYDPTGVFQVLQPGYFKLEGPPNSEWP